MYVSFFLNQNLKLVQHSKFERDSVNHKQILEKLKFSIHANIRYTISFERNEFSEEKIHRINNKL